ncbi:MAG TPA: hypothetical protein H9671_00360 [Firmicutes bacterium]|nr:hypothetical protein [Bacillota bacterium]
MDLLESISSILHCQYMSDLHYIKITHGQADQLRQLEDNHFTLSDCQDAVCYICGDDVPCTSFQEAKQVIIQQLLREEPETRQ